MTATKGAWYLYLLIHIWKIKWNMISIFKLVSRLRNSGTTSALFWFLGWRKKQFPPNSWQFTLQNAILSHGNWPWIQGYAQNCIHQTKVEFANPGHCPIVISRKMMWENTLKRKNNYPPSTTSKVVLEDENESISPDFRTTLSTVNLLHHVNSEWIACSLNQFHTGRKDGIYFPCGC